MHVLVLGATGLIGEAVTRALLAAGHRVTALARRTAPELEALGADVLVGDIARPAWLDACDDVDGIVHAAAAFDSDMAGTDRILTDALIAWTQRALHPRRIVLTGGCWLYPAREVPPLREGDAFDPLPAFAWMLAHRARLRIEAKAEVVMVHPGIVWGDGRGTLGAMADDIVAGRHVPVVGSLDTRWPLVHRDDLAALYVAAIDHGVADADYHGVADAGLRVGDILATLGTVRERPARHHVIPVEQAVAEHGDWIAGQARSQVMDSAWTRDALRWRPVRFWSHGLR
jgi:nucleoside-diphosphate-sugar epimerase